MAETFDIVYPPRGRVTLDGGLNNKFPRVDIADNESPDCLNVIFTNGAAETRGGNALLNTTAIGAFAGDGLYTRRDNNGAETMIAFAGGSAWQLGATTFTTIGSAQSVFTAGNRVGTAQYANKMFIGNGGVTPYKYDGTNFTQHGVPAPTTTMTVASNGTGNVSGSLNCVYTVTFVNSASVEGNYGPLTSTFTVSTTSGTNRLTSIPVAPQSFGVAARRIYRAATTAGPFLRVATINDNTTTTYDDTVAVASLTVTAPTDNGVPPNYSVIQQHQNRLFCNDPANPNYVFYSNSLAPYTFGALNFIPISDNTSDLVKGIEVYQNGIVVLCENSKWLIDMPSTDPTLWKVIRLLSQYGSKSPYGSFLYDNRLMTPAMQSSKFAGFEALGGNSVDPDKTYLDTTTATADLKSNRLEPDMFLVQETYANRISAKVFKNKAYIAVPYGATATDNTRAYLFDFSHSNLTKQGYAWSPQSGFTPSQFTVYGGALYFLDAAATGKVYKMEQTSYNDNSAAINSYIWTKEFSGLPGHENLQKDFRKVKILVDLPGAYYMNLTWRTDSDSGVGTTQQLDLTPGSSLYGTAIYGTAIYGSGSSQKEITVSLGQTTGKRIQFKLSNQNVANQSFKIHGLNFTYNIKGRR